MIKPIIALNPDNQLICDKLINEYSELDSRIEKLRTFMTTDIYRNLPYSRQDLLSRQFYSMLEYQYILHCRIQDFVLNV